MKYLKEAALKNVSENDSNELKVLAPPNLFLTRKPRKDVREVNNIEEIFYYLKLQYSDDENQIYFIKKYSSEHS